MNIERLADGRYRVRWYIAGRGSPRRQKTFPAGTRRKQVETFVANLEIRRAMGELALYEQRKRPLRDLSREWWAKYAVPNLADWTRVGYKRMLVKHIEPRLGSMPVGEITPEVVADFRARLEAAGVGRHSVRQSMVVLQAMYEQAIRWGWIGTNPVKAVKKPTAKRERAVVNAWPRPRSRPSDQSSSRGGKAIRRDDGVARCLPGAAGTRGAARARGPARAPQHGASRAAQHQRRAGGRPEGTRLPPPGHRPARPGSTRCP